MLARRLVLDEVPWCDEATTLRRSFRTWKRTGTIGARRARRASLNTTHGAISILAILYFNMTPTDAIITGSWRQLWTPKILPAKSQGNCLRCIMTSSSKEAQGA